MKTGKTYRAGMIVPEWFNIPEMLKSGDVEDIPEVVEIPTAIKDIPVEKEIIPVKVYKSRKKVKK
jgi:hypothetical protein